ncbi:snake venom 5'-nucleotidase-like isoform X1 [Mercenaria mercenaria]|uniref:snake venom 5'-nucleotidase-like isoform X1 n=1 Tax=Mercenaria mercenaria TaxID=6596 RepID=UPI00234F6267|nr:snake venom 5'-nucleotidase-like isoform X1 [Mercenaria mercenaria]
MLKKTRMNIKHISSVSCIYGFMVNILLLYSFSVSSGFKLTVLHTNDIHSRFEQFNKYGAECSVNDAREGNCFGGVARRHTKIQEIRDSHENVLLLDAGDQFLGTIWSKVHRGRATAFFLNQLGYTAMCLGNHEFDFSVEDLERFMYNVTFPVVSANTDVTREDCLRGKFSKSFYKVVGGEKIGIVGYITPETAFISTPGPRVRFSDILTAVREEVSELTKQGCKIIIALGHAGFSTDKEVAAIDGIDLVVGGHTNTFLYNGYQPSDEKIEGVYPTVVEQVRGNRALVVQAYKMGKYLGYLKLTFNSSGVVTDYSGNPILLGSNVLENTTILSYMDEWKKPVTALSEEAIGFSNVFLDGEEDHCRLQECNVGNLITDAIIDYHLNFSRSATQWAPAAIAVWNGGGIRASIDKGAISAGEIISLMPFGNTLDIVTVKGKNIRDQLEKSVQEWNENEPHGRFLQMSGLHVVYNLQKPPGRRVVSVEAACLECEVPSYSPLIDTDDYKIFLSSFLINGGDGYNFELLKRLRFNTLDFTTVMEYFKRHSPVAPAIEGRIQFVTDAISVATSLSVLTPLVFINLFISLILVYPGRLIQFIDVPFR